MPIVAPTEGALPVDNVGQLLVNALQDAGIIGIDEAIEQPMLNRSFRQANWLLSDWSRSRYLCYRLQDYSFIATGAYNYAVGAGQTVNINPRPDRLEYAFLRFLQSPYGSSTGSGSNSGGAFSSGFSSGFSIQSGSATNNTQPQFLSTGITSNVDIQLDIIPSHEDYSRISVKNLGTLPWAIFYDPAWPVGYLYPWPIPQQSLYEIHVGFKVVLSRFTSLQQPISFPPEYEIALNWCLARRFRTTYQMPADPTIDSLARQSLQTIRKANTAVPTLQMPRYLRRLSARAYDYRGDNNDQY